MDSNRINLLILAAGLITGCAQSTGNFVTGYSKDQTALAEDTIRSLERLYPPARTPLYLNQATSDKYGQALNSMLRSKGYSVREFSSKSKANSNEVSVSYIVDSIGSGLFRVKVLIGGYALSRAYEVNNDTFKPIGAWTRVENSNHV